MNFSSPCTHHFDTVARSEVEPYRVFAVPSLNTFAIHSFLVFAPLLQATHFIHATNGATTCPLGYHSITDIHVCKAGLIIGGTQYTWTSAGGVYESSSYCHSSSWPGSGCFSWETTLFFSNCGSRPLTHNSHYGICMQAGSHE